MKIHADLTVPTPATSCLLEDKIDRGYVRSQFPLEAMHWIKEVENSMSSSSITGKCRGILMYSMTRIASA